MKIPHHRLSAAAAYERAATTPTQPPSRPPSEAKPAEPTPEARAKAPAHDHPLSADEQQMIDRSFPARPEMTLRLYGPGREAQTVNPAAVGSRLDLNA